MTAESEGVGPGDETCCGLNVCVPPAPNAEALSPRVTMTVRGTSGRRSGLEGGPLNNGIRAFIRRDVREMTSLSAPCMHSRKARKTLTARKRALTKN